jgi:hypothetical protein
MFILGHIGIGRALIAPWRRRLPAAPLIAGMLLPDLIDKPLYYARLWDYVSCTRTFGHTGLLLAFIAVIGTRLQSKAIVAVGLGVGTHLFLDCVLDVIGQAQPSSALIALAWPFSGRSFAHYYIGSIAAHAERLLAVPVIASEIVGAALLGWEKLRVNFERTGRPQREHNVQG